MARTERKRLVWRGDKFGQWQRVASERDDSCQHWECNGWKRPARRRARRKALASLRRDPEAA